MLASQVAVEPFVVGALIGALLVFLLCLPSLRNKPRRHDTITGFPRPGNCPLPPSCKQRLEAERARKARIDAQMPKECRCGHCKERKSLKKLNDLQEGLLGYEMFGESDANL